MTENNIKNWIVVPAAGIVWLVALLYPAGIGITYNVYGRTKILVILLVVGHLLCTGCLRHIPQKTFFLIAYLIAVTLLTTALYKHNMLDYLWLYGISYLFALLPVKDTPMRMVSIMYGLLGMAVLFIWNYGSAFSGWNTNAIAMIAFFSFAVMVISFNRAQKLSIFLILITYAALYFIWSESLHSRSGTLFAAIMILGIYRILPFHQWMKKRAMITFFLLVPLFIALFIVLIRNKGFIDALNNWSIATFQKSIFNGRDTLWYQGFQRWLASPIWGNGNLSAANWHNSAVTMLVGGGAVGYLLWIGVNRSILSSGIAYLKDPIVFGLMLGFLSIWLQQTVELGLVASQANAIPYAMLGLLLGRVKTLEREHAD